MDNLTELLETLQKKYVEGKELNKRFGELGIKKDISGLSEGEQKEFNILWTKVENMTDEINELIEKIKKAEAK